MTALTRVFDLEYVQQDSCLCLCSNPEGRPNG
jgi:hypothetical protein